MQHHQQHHDNDHDFWYEQSNLSGGKGIVGCEVGGGGGVTNAGINGVSLGPVAFYFRQRHGKLDWKRLARVNVDQVVREVDLSVLQELLDEVAFAEVTAEDIPPTGVDDLCVKLIRLSQLIIEYLLHVQECQEGYIHGLVRQLEAANKHNEHLRADANLAEKDGRRMRRESAQHQSTLSTCQNLLKQYGIDPGALLASMPSKAGADRSGRAAQPKQLQPAFAFGTASWDGQEPLITTQEKGSGPVEAAALMPKTPVRLCNICGKAFSSKSFLVKHIGRRHPELDSTKIEQQQQQQQQQQEKEAAHGTPVGQEKNDKSDVGGGVHGDNVQPSDGQQGNDNDCSPSPQKKAAAAESARGADGLRDESVGGTDAKDGGEGEVIEGARRLGELVREREHARFRTEMEGLRKEIAELQRGAEKKKAVEISALPTPLTPLQPLRTDTGEAGDRRRRLVRGVITIRRIMREFDSRRKGKAVARWKSASSRHPPSGDRQPLADAADAVLAALPERIAKTAIHADVFAAPVGWTLEGLLSAAHRRADAAAQRSGGGGGGSDGGHVDYSLSSSSQRMEQGHSLGMGSGAEMRSHFHFDPQEILFRLPSYDQIDQARKEVTGELRKRARGFDIDTSRSGIGADEYRTRMEKVLEDRRSAVASRTGLNEAYDRVAEELRLARSDNTTPRLAAAAVTTAALAAGLRRRPSSSSSALPVVRHSSAIQARLTSASPQLGGTSRGTHSIMPSFNGGIRPMPAAREVNRRRVGESEASGIRGKDCVSLLSAGGGDGGDRRIGGSELGADSKELLAIAKRTAEINWEAMKRRRSVSKAAQAAAAVKAASSAAISQDEEVGGVGTVNYRSPASARGLADRAAPAVSSSPPLARRSSPSEITALGTREIEALKQDAGIITVVPSTRQGTSVGMGRDIDDDFAMQPRDVRRGLNQGGSDDAGEIVRGSAVAPGKGSTAAATVLTEMVSSPPLTGESTEVIQSGHARVINVGERGERLSRSSGNQSGHDSKGHNGDERNGTKTHENRVNDRATVVVVSGKGMGQDHEADIMGVQLGARVDSAVAAAVVPKQTEAEEVKHRVVADAQDDISYNERNPHGMASDSDSFGDSNLPDEVGDGIAEGVVRIPPATVGGRDQPSLSTPEVDPAGPLVSQADHFTDDGFAGGWASATIDSSPTNKKPTATTRTDDESVRRAGRGLRWFSNSFSSDEDDEDDDAAENGRRGSNSATAVLPRVVAGAGSVSTANAPPQILSTTALGSSTAVRRIGSFSSFSSSSAVSLPYNESVEGSAAPVADQLTDFGYALGENRELTPGRIGFTQGGTDRGMQREGGKTVKSDRKNAANANGGQPPAVFVPKTTGVAAVAVATLSSPSSSENMDNDSPHEDVRQPLTTEATASLTRSLNTSGVVNHGSRSQDAGGGDKEGEEQNKHEDIRGREAGNCEVDGDEKREQGAEEVVDVLEIASMVESFDDCDEFDDDHGDNGPGEVLERAAQGRHQKSSALDCVLAPATAGKSGQGPTQRGRDQLTDLRTGAALDVAGDCRSNEEPETIAVASIIADSEAKQTVGGATDTAAMDDDDSSGGDEEGAPKTPAYGSFTLGFGLSHFPKRKQAGSSPDQAQSSHPSLPVQDGTIHIEKVDEGGRDDSVNAAVSGQHEQRRAVEMRSGGGVRSGRSGVGSRESDDVMTVQNF